MKVIEEAEKITGAKATRFVRRMIGMSFIDDSRVTRHTPAGGSKESISTSG